LGKPTNLDNSYDGKKKEVYKTHTHTHTQCYSFLLRNPSTELVVSAAYTLIKPDLSRIKDISFSWETGRFGGLRSTL